MRLDFVSDQNPKHLPALAGKMPDWVKSASAVQPEELRDLHAAAFADPVARLHPIHTKVAAYMSVAYLAAAGVNPEAPEYKAAKTAAGIFGITADVEAAEQDLAATVKTAAATDEYRPSFALFVKTAAEGEPTGYYPLTSFCQVQDSARALADDFSRGKLPIGWYRDAAVETMKAASYFGVRPDEVFGAVRDMAVDRCVDFKTAAARVDMRKYAGLPEDAVALYRDIVKSAEAEGPSEVLKYVNAIEDLDRALEVKYAGVQLNPWQIFHGGPATEELEKMASSNVVCFNVMVPGVEFANIPARDVQMRMSAAQAAPVLEAIKTAATDPARASRMVADIPLTVQRDLLQIAVQRGNNPIAA